MKQVKTTKKAKEAENNPVQKRESIDCVVFDEVEKKYPKFNKRGVPLIFFVKFLTAMLEIS